MSTRRLSRAESQARTRAALVDAAAFVFAARGFEGATMDEIAAEAGFTRGAVYSNFADKADLFLAVLDERLEARAAEVGGLLEGAAGPGDFFVALAAADAGRGDEERTWELLRAEFRLYAARHPEVRERLVEANRRLLDWVTSAVRALFEAAGVEPPLPYEELGAIVQALDEGLCMLRLVDPERIRSDLLFDTLALLYGLATGTSPGTARRPRPPG